MKKLMTTCAMLAVAVSVTACGNWWDDMWNGSHEKARHENPDMHGNINDHDANTNKDRYDTMEEDYKGNWYKSPRNRHRDR